MTISVGRIPLNHMHGHDIDSSLNFRGVSGRENTMTAPGALGVVSPSALGHSSYVKKVQYSNLHHSSVFQHGLGPHSMSDVWEAKPTYWKTSPRP